MDLGAGYLLYILIMIIFAMWPVWLILGIIYLIKRWNKKPLGPSIQTASSGEKDDLVSRSELAGEIETAIEKESNEYKRGGLNHALEIVRKWKLAPAATIQHSQVESVDTAKEVNAASAPLNPEAQKTKNTIALLYLGAFMLVAAMGLFVGIANVSGVLKTFIVILTAGIFYVAGLWMYKHIPTLKPAAVAFTAIGMAFIPLIGAALTLYMDIDGAQAWWLVSLVGVGLYIFVLSVISESIMGYLTAFMWLSFVESSINLIEVPTFLMIWGLVFAGILLRLLVRVPLIARQRAALEQTSQLIIPTTIFAAFLIFLPGLEYAQLAGTLALSALFYIQEAHFVSEPKRSWYRIGAHVALLFAIVLLAHDYQKSFLFDGQVLALAVAGQLLMLAFLAKRDFKTVYDDVLYYITAFLPLLVTIFWIEDHNWFIGGWLFTVFVSIILLMIRNTGYTAVPIVVAVLALPYAIGSHLLAAPLDSGITVALWGIAAVLLFGARHYLAREANLPQIFTAGYVMALGLGLFWAFVDGGNLLIAITSGLLALVAAALSFYEKNAKSIVLVPMFATISMASFYLYLDISWVENLVLASSIVALATYIFLYLVPQIDEERRKALVIKVLSLGVLSWLAGWGIDDLPRIYAPLTLLATALVGYAEARRYKLSVSYELVAQAAGMVALQHGIFVTAEDTDLLVYTNLWAAYLGAAAYQMKLHGGENAAENARSLTYGALAVFTVPTAFKALSEPEVYGILLIGEHAILAIAGSMLNNRLYIYWGVVTAILAIVYMLRDLAYLNLGLIAVVLIAFAVYRLSRQSK